ncbi:MAG: antibiotic biosynthesis monooxygenase [Polyangiaceae bacterium]
MIIEYIRYNISENERSAFEAAYERACVSLDASPHCLAHELSRCHEEPQRYILRIEWDSLQGHLDGFRKSEVFRHFLEEVRPFIPRIEEMQHYEVGTRQSIYSTLGGAGPFFRLAKRMHELMREDDTIGPLFTHAAPTHVPHLGMWLVEVFGGPKLYSETLGDIGPILSRHANRDITEEQRAAFAACARRAVDEIVPPAQQSARDAIARYVEWGTHVAVSNSRPDHVADPGAGVPSWGWDSTS